METPVITEADTERDRKTCIALDQKITGSQRELAQWILNHPRYPAPIIAQWLECGVTRVKDLRTWAARDFEGNPFRAGNLRRARGDEALISLDNSDDESIDGGDGAGFVIAVIKNATEKAHIAARNIQDGLTESERVEIVNAIDALMRKWKSVRNKAEGKRL